MKNEITKILNDYAIKGKDGLNRDIRYIKDEYFHKVAERLYELLSPLQENLKITNALYDERQKLLDAIPECELHGKCVPYALEWIKKMKEGH